MKITDLALIFIGITLPIIIIVYVNVSYTIKAEEQEMYYQKLINIAVEDTANQMKEVENNDTEIDYGYSGLQNSKVSVNAEIAKNTFFNSLYNNMGIKGNDAAEHYLQTFVPALAIIDYNGVYISSQEQYKKNGQTVIEHVVKPKRYYTYSYYIDGNNIIDGITNDASKTNHTIEFTMDDYITHRASNSNEVKSFYISDSNNNKVLIGKLQSSSLSNSDIELLDNVVKKLQTIRKQVIIDTIVKELTNATNKANSYASSLGISYDFVFPTTTQDEMENAIKNIGVFGFIQGLNVGNKYLNAKSYAISKLEETTKYYFSIFSDKSKYKINLYHKDQNCPEYKISINEGITPLYVITKQQAAAATVSYKPDGEDEYKQYMGFYPCPICRP